MKKKLKKFVEWLEEYNEFCHANSNGKVLNQYNDIELSESSKKFYYQSMLIERILNRMIEKKLIADDRKQKSEGKNI